MEANRTLGFLDLPPGEGIQSLSMSLHPVPEYACSIWDPSSTALAKHKAVQQGLLLKTSSMKLAV